MLQRKVVIYHYVTSQNCLSSLFGNTEPKSNLKETRQLKPIYLLSLYEAVAIANPSPTCSPSIIHISFKTHHHRDHRDHIAHRKITSAGVHVQNTNRLFVFM